MNTLDATISMLEDLPESELQAIHDITYILYSKTVSTLRPLKKEQILEDLSVSREQVKNGEFSDAEDAITEIEVKYGI